MNYENDCCIICMDNFPSRILICKHRFCKICIVRIIKEFDHPNCPSCREEIYGMISTQESSDDELDVMELLKFNRYISRRQRNIEYSILQQKNNSKCKFLMIVFVVFILLIFILKYSRTKSFKI
ncbi:hypothetical protein COB52_04120 [Candidatus Kaiserbacteria bacterium]|nr:MAG: hypothetical protein COB52_04120 [Candidatus Kaiserbacteria bacterium]